MQLGIHMLHAVHEPADRLSHEPGVQAGSFQGSGFGVQSLGFRGRVYRGICLYVCTYLSIFIYIYIARDMVTYVGIYKRV